LVEASFLEQGEKWRLALSFASPAQEQPPLPKKAYPSSIESLLPSALSAGAFLGKK